MHSSNVCDFILADDGYFTTNQTWGLGSGIVPEEVIADVTAQDGIAKGGRVYGQLDGIQQFAPEEWVRQTLLSCENPEEIVNDRLSHLPHTKDGRVMDYVQTYGMEPFALDALTVIEGNLSGLYEPESRSVAAVYFSDDYGKPHMDSHWAKVGDTVTLRVPEKWEYYSPETGEVHDDPADFGEQRYMARPSVYHDETFTVDALVLVPPSLSYRYYGSDEFVLNAETFQKMTGKSDVMLYAFDAKDGAEDSLEDFLQHYAEVQNPRYGYESTQTYTAEFESFRSMFLTLGTLLSFVVGLVGVLNFINAILTGILTRKRELAMLQSIGMTGGQLKAMLVIEGLLYAFGSLLLALVFSLAAAPLTASMLSKLVWFFTYHATFMPILIIAPIFLLMGCIVPILVYHRVSKQTIVERLRESEG